MLVLAGLLCAARISGAQAGDVEARLRAQRAELDRIKRQRDSVEARLRELERTRRDASAQAQNLETQANLTARSVSMYNRRLLAMNEEVDGASAELARAQDELLLKQATMRKRLIDIYKRGPLYSVEVLLTARSFGELLARYKYLRTIAQDDRARVERMEQLRLRVAEKRNVLVVLSNELVVSRDEQAQEERRLRTLEDQLQRRAASATQSAAALQRRIAQYTADSARIANFIASLEANRRAGGDAISSPAVPRAARGTLDWPVDGDILYSYGRLKHPNNTTTRWDGIGIAAPAGTPVKAVADGVVRAAQQWGTYGLCVILEHGQDYSLYCGLSRMMVGANQTVTKGQQLGTVGTSDPALGPHLHFQIRAMSATSSNPVAIDPLEWLRNR